MLSTAISFDTMDSPKARAAPTRRRRLPALPGSRAAPSAAQRPSRHQKVAIEYERRSIQATISSPPGWRKKTPEARQAAHTESAGARRRATAKTSHPFSTWIARSVAR